MTIEQHNQALGIVHLAYGGINAFTVLALTMFFGLAFAGNPDINLSEPFTLTVFGLAFVLLNLLLVVPPVLAGYAILKRKSWARTAGIVSAVLSALNIPHGTALSIYTFWFFFGEGGRRYENGWATEYRYALGDAPPPPLHDWIGTPDRQPRQHEYAPPAQSPPNRRD